MTFTSDPATTQARFERLREYLMREVLGPAGMVCSGLGACERSATFYQDGRPRTDVEFATGQLSHVGEYYDLAEDGQPLRILIIAMEIGRGGQITLGRRRQQLAESADLAMTKRNTHMRGVTNALRPALGRRPGADRAGEMLDLGGYQPAHLFDAYAMTNCPRSPSAVSTRCWRPSRTPRRGDRCVGAV